MFTTKWSTSARIYNIKIERNVDIPVGNGISMKADIYRPDAEGQFPVILAASPYSKEIQTMPMMPVGFSYARGWMESGDPNFYVRRGYVMAIATIRGSRGSGGTFGNIEPDPDTVKDLAEAIQWLGHQSWSSGKVGMNGVSYFSLVAKRVAMLEPSCLAALFSPYGFTDGYRDVLYRGGILAAEFMEYWLKRQAPFFNIENTLRKSWGEDKYNAAIQMALRDPEIAASPVLANALRNPDVGGNPVLLEILLNPLFNDYWRERVVDFDKGCSVPAYLGGDWGMFGLHLPGDLRAWEHWKGPKRMTLGPPIYLDRPCYQYAYESLRWFDHWLKGIDTGMMDEPPVQVFIEGTGEWRTSHEWPLPETRWTPFYLHRGGLLSEHEFWPNEGWSNYEDSAFARHSLEFWSPPMVEVTELCGPSVFNLWGSTTDTDVLWFVSLLHQDAQGQERVLTRGWLRGSQRKLDTSKSKPWQPVHVHDERQPLSPNQIYEFNIEIQSIGIELKPGERIGLRIKGADNEVPVTINEDIGSGAISRPMCSIVSVHHNDDCPSHLLLPVTRGNRVGTFISGGKLPSFAKT
ncbi:MAG: CocE/NonD family hydrolase [Betaproteobacteria bacterium]|nr:CocE/NonD family hydrolase [Betaproteobacteria bacterium]